MLNKQDSLDSHLFINVLHCIFYISSDDQFTAREITSL